MIPVATAHPNKAALRAAVLSRRDGLNARERAEASARIAERVLAIVGAKPPRAIAAYLPIRSECDPRPIIERAWALSIAVALPAVVDAETLVFRRYQPGTPLVRGGHGTLAPPPDQPVLDPELVVVPVVAFDRSGLRLGHGRGFYDRAVARLRAHGVVPTLVGVAFAVQEVAAIPGEAHDARLDWIVTEEETLDLRRLK